MMDSFKEDKWPENGFFAHPTPECRDCNCPKKVPRSNSAPLATAQLNIQTDGKRVQKIAFCVKYHITDGCSTVSCKWDLDGMGMDGILVG